MASTLNAELEAANRKRKKRVFRYRILSILACITVFFTTYALVLPAITMDEDAYAKCGLIDHSHSEECYNESGDLICEIPEHEHDMDCFSPALAAPVQYSCGYDYQHTHNEDCYSNGVLICTYQEHTHTAECEEMPAVSLRLSSTEVFYSYDLADFIDSYELLDRNGVPVTDHKVYVGEDYSIRIHFSESNIEGDNRQFRADDNYHLIYQLDTAHLTVTNITNTEPQPIVLDNGIQVGSFTIGSDGKVIVSYDRVKNDGSSSEKLFCDNYPNSDLYIEFKVNIDSNDSENKLRIDLGSEIVINVDAPETGELSVQKSKPTYRAFTRSVDYDVTVMCGHGVVYDLDLSDVATIIDNSTGTAYDLSSGLFSYSGYTITDLNDNPIPDGSGGTVNDISQLAGTDLHGGEGYKIHYSIILEPAYYDMHTAFSTTINNTFTADGLKPDDTSPTGFSPETADDTTGGSFDINNLNKNVSLAGDVTIDGTTYQLLFWQLTVGDYNTDVVQESQITLTDTLGQAGQHFFQDNTDTSHKATCQYYNESSEWSGTQQLIWGTDITVDDTGATEKAYFKLPAGGCAYRLNFYTYAEKPSSGTVNYNNSADITWKPGTEWETTSRDVPIISVGDTPTVEKTFTKTEDGWIYYQVEAIIPGTQYNKNVHLRDTFGNEAGKIKNDVEILSVSVQKLGTDEPPIEHTPYVDGGPVENTYKYFYPDIIPNGERNYFSITFATSSYNSYWQHSYWPYDYDAVLTITYRVSRSQPEVAGGVPTGYTLDDRLAGSYYLKNTAEIFYGEYGVWTNYVSDNAIYIEINPAGKKGSVTDQKDGIISYKAAFTNNKLPDGEITTNSYKFDKVAILSSDFTDGYFHDAFDSRMEYVDGSLFVEVYPRRTDVRYNLATNFGEGIPSSCYCTFIYAGSDISDTEINAKWSDFTGSYTKNRVEYTDLESLLKAYPEDFGLVFRYDMKVEEQYRQSLVDTAPVLKLTNEADFGWTTPSGPSNTGGVFFTVDYSTDILKKEHTPEDPSLDRSAPIHYTVTVNPYGYDLTPQESFMLEDTMCEDLHLVLATLIIEEGSIDPVTGETTWSEYTGDPHIAYDPETNKLSARIPDNRPMRLRYDCRINSTADTITLSNSVSIEGFSEFVGDDIATFILTGTGTSGGGSNEKFNLMKHDSETHTGLTGAKFALYGSNSSPAYQKTAPDGVEQTLTLHEGTVTLYYYGTYETGNGASSALYGSVEILDTALETQGHYAVLEIEAPDGYLPDNTVHEFYWNQVPASPIAGIQVLVDNDTLIINNEPVTTVELPMTGGPGVPVWTCGGMLLILFSVTALVILRHRNRKKAI